LHLEDKVSASRDEMGSSVYSSRRLLSDTHVIFPSRDASYKKLAVCCACARACVCVRVCVAVSDGVTTAPVVQSGTELYCYECLEKYTKSFDPANAPCLNNLTQITVRQCSPADRYCQVLFVVLPREQHSLIDYSNLGLHSDITTNSLTTEL